MDGQILGGGVILLVAGALWLVYLVPSWQSRHQYNATERNAVRLSQALRVLAETSETPEAVQVELGTRAAYEQQKHAKRAEAERVRLAKDAEFRRARVDAERERTAAELEKARLEARRDLAIAARNTPELRRARARRRTRLVATSLALIGLASTVVGIVLTVVAGAFSPLLFGALVALAGLVALGRMSAVARQARQAPVAVPVMETRRSPRTATVMDVELPRKVPTWTPRTLPQPMSAVAGSSAAQVQDQADAREALRRAAVEEAARDRAAESAPTPISSARLSNVGIVSDEAIEAHVRELLARRAAG